MGKKAKLKDILGRQPTEQEVELTKRIDKEMAELTKRAKEMVNGLIEEGFLTGSLKQLDTCFKNAVNVEIWKRETYADMCKLREKEDITPLKDLRVCTEEEQKDTKDKMNLGYY